MAAPGALTVYRAIQGVAAAMAQRGIGKSRRNQQQGFAFRGIDDVLNALAPLLPEYGLIIIPRMLSRQMTERATKKGDPLFSVVVDAEFDFIATADGSRHTARTFGEAMDTADKATNKAMSVAYKYAAFLTFCIPVEAMAADADATTPDVAGSRTSNVVSMREEADAPKGYREWLTDMQSTADNGFDALRKAWNTSPREFRAHLDRTARETWEGLKTKAQAVDAKAVPA
jgi:hypothetical protein